MFQHVRKPVNLVISNSRHTQCGKSKWQDAVRWALTGCCDFPVKSNATSADSSWCIRFIAPSSRPTFRITKLPPPRRERRNRYVTRCNPLATTCGLRINRMLWLVLIKRPFRRLLSHLRLVHLQPKTPSPSEGVSVQRFTTNRR